MSNEAPTWVYICQCDHRGILYVGIAYDVRRRLRQHARTKPWWPEVRFVCMYEFPTREEALRVESFGIANLRPVYNVIGQISLPKIPCQPASDGFLRVMNGQLVDLDANE